MSCLPGLDVSTNCSVAFSTVFPEQWGAMRFLTLFLPVVGLVLAAAVLSDYAKPDFVDHSRSTCSVLGIILIVMSELCLILYYAIDPGFLRAVTGGFFSLSYAAGLTTFLWMAAGLSNCATAILLGFWISLLQVGGRRWVGLSPVAFVVTLAICAYNITIAIVGAVRSFGRVFLF
jgi:hypothetical protein